MTGRRVHIHYRRLPDREDVYVQDLLVDHPEVKITFQPSTPISAPVMVDGVSVLEPGSPAVWFTFPGVWHDIGRFHDRHGRFTGLYANVLTPCVLHPDGATGHTLRWETTDLFLDVWRGVDGVLRLLDEDDLERALATGVLDVELGRAARAEAQRILAAEARGDWPPAVVSEWPLERVVERA
ncbi:MAG: DUF402 domain-containing protein [Gemmatimonadales bacterium]|nr:MAG: DUF402 domain-containing protein [Gemmatimonadales bacterium]